MKYFFLTLLLLMTTNVAAETVVVVHPSNTTEITLSDIKKLFLGKKQAFRNGNGAVLATLEEGNPIRKAFNTNVLNKTESMYVGYWAKLTFTGQATPPQEVSGSNDMKTFVANNPNAIGIMDQADVDDSVRVVAEF